MKTAAQRRIDLLGETRDGHLVHIELQSTNDRQIGARMLDYGLAVYWAFAEWPEQLVIYVGEEPLRMTGRFREFECRIVDIREFDGSSFLESERLEDNIVSILMRLRDERRSHRSAVSRGHAEGPGRRQARRLEGR